MNRPSPTLIADAATREWQEHPRIRGIFLNVLLTSEANPFANVNLVKVPPGGVVSLHQHPEEIETVYVLSGKSVLTLDDTDVPFKSGQIVAIPMGLEHELRNTGSEPVELITFFTPPII